MNNIKKLTRPKFFILHSSFFSPIFHLSSSSPSMYIRESFFDFISFWGQKKRCETSSAPLYLLGEKEIFNFFQIAPILVPCVAPLLSLFNISDHMRLPLSVRLLMVMALIYSYVPAATTLPSLRVW